jgi:hypothetical protein
MWSLRLQLIKVIRSQFNEAKDDRTPAQGTRREIREDLKPTGNSKHIDPLE